MTSDIIQVTEKVVSCSDNGQHPLVYINLKKGKGSCHYCGQMFALAEINNAELEAAAA